LLVDIEVERPQVNLPDRLTLFRVWQINEENPVKAFRSDQFRRQTTDIVARGDDERLQFDHLQNLCAVDWLEPDPKKAKKFDHDIHIEVVYHLQSYSLKHRITVKVILPRWKNDEPGELPDVPTVTGVWKIADWHERECYDLSGINFVGHPNLVRILCAEDWVGHPLRKDYEFPLEYHGIRAK